MAFCSKCGAKLEDGTKFCGTCGAEQTVQETPAAQEAPKAEAPAAAKEAKPVDKNKMVGLIAFAVVAVAAIVLVVVLFSSIFGGGYKKPLKTIKKAINGQTTDIEDYFDVLPKFVGTVYDDALALVKDIDKDMVKELEEGIEESLEGLYEGLEDTYGRKVKLSYEIADKEKLDKDDCEDIAEYYTGVVESLEDTLGVDIADKDELEEIVEKLEDTGMLDDVSSKQVDKAIKLISNLAGEFSDIKISKAYILEVELTFKGNENENSLELDVCVAKINGKWCIEPLTTYAEISGEDAEDVINDLMKELRRMMY